MSSRGFGNYDTRGTPAYLQIDTLERLLKEAEEREESLRTDAERYRLLRSGETDLHVCRGPSWDRLHLYGEALDKLVDAFVQAKRGLTD